MLWGIRLLLGREPADAEVDTLTARFDSVQTIVQALLCSPEFRLKHPLLLSPMPHDSPPLDVEWQIDEATAAAFLAHVATIWGRLGEQRPYWSVLATDQFAADSDPAQIPAFFESGAYDSELLLAAIARAGRRPREFEVCFEFGCGLGRVTSHLHRHFKHVIACDLSRVHLAIAERALHERGIANVELRHASALDFGMTGEQDLWFSRLVLQHNSPPLIAMIIERALTQLRPGGLAVFQVPTYGVGYRFKVDEYRRGLGQQDAVPFEMHVLPQPALFAIARRAGCGVLEVCQDTAAGESFISHLFTVQKDTAS